jgi:predicted mannosyl-3-phosphoglycerate phosphatase (HAD superfamily)
VDLVPQAAGKGAAMEYVRRGLEWPAEHMVAVGDSANDILMFEAAANVIVVGNSRPEVLQWVAAQHQQLAGEGHEMEGGGRRVLAAQQPAAAGILEGLHGLGFAVSGP